MAYFEEGSEAMVALEGMVDEVGLANVLYALAHICGAKSSHAEDNWQDTSLAKLWSMNYRKMIKAGDNTTPTD